MFNSLNVECIELEIEGKTYRVTITSGALIETTYKVEVKVLYIKKTTKPTWTLVPPQNKWRRMEVLNEALKLAA